MYFKVREADFELSGRAIAIDLLSPLSTTGVMPITLEPYDVPGTRPG
jgi:hypothetical protein